MYNTHVRDWHLRTANSSFENPRTRCCEGSAGQGPGLCAGQTSPQSWKSNSQEPPPGNQFSEWMKNLMTMWKWKKRKGAHAESDEGNQHFHIQKNVCQLVLIVKVTTNKNTDSISVQVYVSFQMYILPLFLLPYFARCMLKSLFKCTWDMYSFTDGYKGLPYF